MHIGCIRVESHQIFRQGVTHLHPPLPPTHYFFFFSVSVHCLKFDTSTYGYQPTLAQEPVLLYKGQCDHSLGYPIAHQKKKGKFCLWTHSCRLCPTRTVLEYQNMARYPCTSTSKNPYKSTTPIPKYHTREPVFLPATSPRSTQGVFDMQYLLVGPWVCVSAQIGTDFFAIIYAQGPVRIE